MIEKIRHFMLELKLSEWQKYWYMDGDGGGGIGMSVVEKDKE